MKKTMVERIEEATKAGKQVLKNVNANGTIQNRFVISVERDLPTINGKGNRKLQSQNGQMQILTYARLGQFTRDALQKDGYNFPSVIPADVCVNCEVCKGLCYNKRLYFRDNTVNNRLNNYLHSLKDSFVGDMNSILDKYTTRYNKISQSIAVRIHVEGEISDLKYFRKLVDIANSNPHILFYTYTKNYDLMIKHKALIPNNFNIMISSWDGMKAGDAKKVNKLKCLGFKVYHARQASTPLPEGFSQCNNDCNKCLNCIKGLNSASCAIH